MTHEEAAQELRERLVNGRPMLRKAVSTILAAYDAAIKDLRHTDICDVCAHAIAPDGCDVECDTCTRDCKCIMCRGESLWKWRGPEPGKEEA